MDNFVRLGPDNLKLLHYVLSRKDDHWLAVRYADRVSLETKVSSHLALVYCVTCNIRAYQRLSYMTNTCNIHTSTAQLLIPFNHMSTVAPLLILSHEHSGTINPFARAQWHY